VTGLFTAVHTVEVDCAYGIILRTSCVGTQLITDLERTNTHKTWKGDFEPVKDNKCLHNMAKITQFLL